MPDQTPQVSIVMPCLNEAGTLPACLDEARQALAALEREHGLSGEIVVADNGSTDDSRQIARQLGARVVRVAEPGYGSALIGGISAAHGRFVVIGDSDCSYDFREAPALVARLVEGYELCMGTRMKGRILPGAMPWKNRYIGNPALSGILNLLFRSGLSDAHCGLRAFTKEAFERMRLSATGMEFASEMVIKATLLGLKRTEAPVTLRPDRRGRPPHLRPWRDGWRHLRYLFMLSPGWLFFVPSALFGALGVVVGLTLLLNAHTEMVALGPFWFGDHWMVVASGLLLLSHQAMIFGLASTLYGVNQGYRRPTRLLAAICGAARLEYMLLTGLCLVATGAGLIAVVILEWSRGGFGALAMMREMIAGVSLGVIGMQSFFGGFLISIVAGNDARLKRDTLTIEERPEAEPTGSLSRLASGALGARTTED
ncbi:MAG: glycosyltransferase family 2 protein [Inquilinus sp.]|nr:glycosyltransferase family 2 protein [Inquilinus sp.]